MLLTDGAACYPPFARKQSLLHEYVRHNRGEFVKDVKRGRSTIKCHTGTIDAAWTSCKKIIPNSLGAKHNDVMLYAKMWQWRFVNKYKKLLEKTVEMLRQMKWKDKSVMEARSKWITKWCFTEVKIQFPKKRLKFGRPNLTLFQGYKLLPRCGETHVFFRNCVFMSTAFGPPGSLCISIFP